MWKILNIESINPDNFITKAKPGDVIQKITSNKTHIEAIQETQIPYDVTYARNGYKFITSAERQTEHGRQKYGMSQGGVAVLIQEDAQKHIDAISRINHRVATVTLTSKEESAPVTIIATYAPHRQYSHRDNKNVGN